MTRKARYNKHLARKVLLTPRQARRLSCNGKARPTYIVGGRYVRHRSEAGTIYAAEGANSCRADWKERPTDREGRHDQQPASFEEGATKRKEGATDNKEGAADNKEGTTQ